MTSSHIEILLWDSEPGLFYNKKEEGGCIFASPTSPPTSMAAFLCSEPGLRPKTVDELCQRVHIHHFTHEDPGEPTRPIDPNRYIVVDINIYKRPLPLQHESIVFHLQVPDHEPGDIYILADRNIDAASLSRCLSSKSRSQKLASDTMHFIQAAGPPWQYGSVIWTMPVSGPNFTLNLAQVVTLLSAVSHADEQYDIMKKNCYWFTRMVRELVIRIINHAAPGALPLPVDYGHHLWHTGCFLGFRMDDYSVELADNAYTNYENESHTFLDKVTFKNYIVNLSLNKICLWQRARISLAPVPE